MRVLSWRLGTRPSKTRIPFRYGKACLVDCPQALLEIKFEIDGRAAIGYASDCLPPSWFDKSGCRTFAEQIEDMLNAIAASAAFLGGLPTIPSLGTAAQLLWESTTPSEQTKLLDSFGHSMVERCVIDAGCRHYGRSFRELLSSGELYKDYTTELDAWGIKTSVRPWQRDMSTDAISVRHTVGLGDPLTKGDIDCGQRLDDGLPETLEDHLLQNGICYLKVKVGNHGLDDLNRLLDINRVVATTGNRNVQYTIDGNEQYASIPEFVEFWNEVSSHPDLKLLRGSVLAVEQPLNRSRALEEDATIGLREFSRQVPVIIDESDATKDDCWKAICLGYSGTSSKACKGITKALVNRQLIADVQNGDNDRRLVMTGEDLCCVGVVALQSDLALVSAMGITHVERNGHHYHEGLRYLDEAHYDEIIACHGDLYASVDGVPALKIRDGKISLNSVNQNGFGFGVDPHFETYQVVRQGGAG